MLIVVMLSVVMLSDFMLSVVMLDVDMPSVFMLNVVILSVVAPNTISQIKLLNSKFNLVLYRFVSFTIKMYRSQLTLQKVTTDNIFQIDYKSGEFQLLFFK
jgi:hypothetical protein